MDKVKRLMILGAGPGQVPMILAAVEAGLFVITVDNIPGNAGHRLSNLAVDCSTMDCRGVANAAESCQIDGIVTFASDVAVPTVAVVADRLGLRGCSPDTATTMSNKAHFRNFQARHPHLRRPAFAVGSRFEDIFDTVQATVSLPFLFKPVDTSGSRGIRRIDEFTPSACRAGFDYAQQFSHSGMVCAEELLTGADVSGDGFLHQGRFFGFLTEKHKRGFMPTGHSLPATLTIEEQTAAVAEVEATCGALNYTDGPIDFDIMLTPDGPTVIEMSPRLGGNGIPSLIKRAAGLDLIRATIQWALGHEVHLSAPPADIHPCGSWVFGAARAGTVQRICSEQEIRSSVPAVFDCSIQCGPGDHVPALEHSGNSLGYFLFDCPANRSYAAIVSELETRLNLTVI